MPLYCFCFPLRFPGAPKPSRASFFPKRGNKIRNHYQRYNKLPPPAPLFEWSASSQDPHRTGASARTEVQPRPRMTAFSPSGERMCFCGIWGTGAGASRPSGIWGIRQEKWGKGSQALFPIQKTTWKAGESEVICLYGGSLLCHIGQMAKNFRADLAFQKQKISDSRSQINHSRSRR